MASRSVLAICKCGPGSRGKYIEFTKVCVGEVVAASCRETIKGVSYWLEASIVIGVEHDVSVDPDVEIGLSLLVCGT